MDDNLMEKVMEEVMKKMGDTKGAKKEAPKSDFNPGITEFVGTAIGDTIGLVIANVDHNLHDFMKIDPKYKSIGIIGARTGAGPPIMAADEAVKATNTEIISIELPRDTKGGAGHGCLILFGAEDVSDARRAPKPDHVKVQCFEIGHQAGLAKILDHDLRPGREARLNVRLRLQPALHSFLG